VGYHIVLAGTHLTGKTAPQLMEDPSAQQRDEVYCTGPAGTVYCFNAHLCHGGTLNQTAAPRRACHGYYTRRHNAQQLPQQEHIQPWNYQRMTATAVGRATIAILDVEAPTEKHLVARRPLATWDDDGDGDSDDGKARL
jgi:ectoine hydroxylase-related dioxygenase (phytanoyl-CoA dioxygenase family)